MASRKLKPVLTEEEFNHLHKQVAESRSTTKRISVDRKALDHLLKDQSALWAICEVDND